MINYFIEQFRRNKYFKLITFLFLGLLLWWITILARGLTDSIENSLFTVIYPLLALIGGIAGFFYAKKWGGFRSTLGRAMTFLALGLLAQFLGQLCYIYYIFVLNVEIPYPSIGDASYFASVILYIVGAFQLAKVSGVKLTLKTASGKIKAFGIPAIVLLISYLVLLKGYDFSTATPLLIFFDFGWPIGQVVYVSVATLALLISKEILGGMMRKPIMLLILALILQYFADFVFSYMFSAHPDLMHPGDVLDLLYCASYFLMAISLISIGNMFYKVQES